MSEQFSRSGYASAYPAGIERHFWHIARNDIVYRWLQPKLDAGDLVMDVGCGTGIVVDYLNSRGVNIRGIELGPAPVTAGLAGLIDTQQDLFDLPAPIRQQIKVVLLLDVLEHIGDRPQFLQRICRELPNCQWLILTVPARMEIWSDYDEHWGHYLRYDRPGLEAELADSGFAAQRSAYFFHWVYLASLVLKLFGVSKKTDFQPLGERGFKTFCHRLLGWATAQESRLIPAPVPGSSIICGARRVGNTRANP